MMIAPGEAGRRSERPQTSVHRTWRVAGLYAQEKRTKRGHCGQSTDRSAAGRGNALAGGRFRHVRFVKAIALVSPAAIDFTPQPSGPCFVRSVRAVSVSP